MLLIGCHKRLNRLSQTFETLRSIVFDRLEHKTIFRVPQAISFFGVEALKLSSYIPLENLYGIKKYNVY
jgi:hypothetical protein